MKVAVTCVGRDLDAPVDQRFGRCPNLLVVKTDDMSYEAVENPFIEQGGGVGGRLASWLADRGVAAVLTGATGPHAQQALDAAGIRVVTGCDGIVRQAVEAFKTSNPTSHQPAASTMLETARGQGLGKGRGRGGGGMRRQRRHLRRRRCDNG